MRDETREKRNVKTKKGGPLLCESTEKLGAARARIIDDLVDISEHYKSPVKDKSPLRCASLVPRLEKVSGTEPLLPLERSLCTEKMVGAKTDLHKMPKEASKERTCHPDLAGRSVRDYLPLHTLHEKRGEDESEETPRKGVVGEKLIEPERDRHKIDSPIESVKEHVVYDRATESYAGVSCNNNIRTPKKTGVDLGPDLTDDRNMVLGSLKPSDLSDS